MEKGKEQIELETAPDDKIEKGKSKREKRIDIGSGTKVDGPSDDASVSSGVNFIEFNGENGAESVGRLKDENLVRIKEGCDRVGSKLEELEQSNVGSIDARRGRQLMKRSNLLAKQVISIQSALSLGFVSQLWVDTVSVGDVVLIPDESVMENELKMVGLETVTSEVTSSYHDPADAKLTPVLSSSSDRFGSRNGGTMSLIPNMVATKSGTSFPFENRPVAT
ncbi:hypothetical protein TEA_006628 [Camellia sinensis var. sinensis]|uniref:Uncharacterized protein n=1 Tax=Camellia sinensis var. sinensis TaxID=542762 RepID=A0A4S4EVH4_CAMSN|nr:hypothetical protein TEA_006628 [Camellia sinensis var. sinensis]